MLRLCVFDLDGTLVDSLDDLANSANYALGKHGFPKRSVAEYRSFLGDGLPKLLQRALGESYTEEDGMRLVHDFDDYYLSHHEDCSRPYDGMVELLNQLRMRGVKLAVLSNKPDYFSKLMIEALFPPNTFVRVQGKSDRFLQKPNPASLLDILEELGVNRDQVLYIGDSNIDVFTARNAGVKVAGVTWGYRDRQELVDAGADFIVDAPDEILQLVVNGDW